MGNSSIVGSPLFRIGPVDITMTVVTTWGIMLILWFISWFITRRFSLKPRFEQALAEGIFSAIEDTITTVLPDQTQQVLPFIGTLWIFIVTANLTGLIPNLKSPTSDLSLTAALAILVFLSVHWFGIRSQGLVNYLRFFLEPNPILLPFHIISEISRTVALAIRLFGNMMSLQLASMLILLVAGFLVPVPLLLLHIVEALVQAYLFGMLALIYIAGGIQAQKIKQKEGKE